MIFNFEMITNKKYKSMIIMGMNIENMILNDVYVKFNPRRSNEHFPLKSIKSLNKLNIYL